VIAVVHVDHAVVLVNAAFKDILAQVEVQLAQPAFEVIPVIPVQLALLESMVNQVQMDQLALLVNKENKDHKVQLV
jgi:hypothetical protein